MRRLKENGIGQRAFEKLPEEERADKIVRGVFVDRDIPEYTQLYDQVIAQAQRSVAA